MKLYKKIVRDLWIYKGQFFTIFLMTMIGMMAFSGIHAYMDGMDRTAQRYYQTNNLQDLWVSSQNITDENLESYESIDHVKDVNRAFVFNSKLEGYKDVNLESNVIEKNSISKMYVVKGKRFDSNKKGAWLDSYLAEYLKIDIGDTLKLKVFNQTIHVKVLGFVNSPDHVYFVKDSTEIFPSHDHYGFVYLSSKAYEDQMGMAPIFNKAYIDVDSKKNENAVKKDLLKCDSNIIAVTNRKACSSYMQYKSEVDEGKTYSMVFTAMFLFIAILSVMSTMNRFVRKQRVQIGTLKALGFSNSKITLHYVSFGFLISLFASFLGLIVGALSIGNIFLKIEGEYFEMPNMKIEVLPIVYLVALLTVLAISIITYLSSHKILKQSASVALRMEAPKINTKQLNWTLKLKNAKLSVKWNLRDISRNKGRTLASLAGIVGCTMLLVCAFGMYDSINDYLKWEYQTLNQYKNKISLQDTITEDQLNTLTKLYGNRTTQDLTIEFQSKKKTVAKTLTINDSKGMVTYTNHNKKIIKLKENGIYVTEKLAEQYGFKKGDQVKWHILGNDTWYSSKIVGLNRDPQNQQLNMTKAYYESLGLSYHPTSIYTNSKVKKSDGISKISTLSSIQKGMENMLETMKSMVVLLIGFAVLLGSVILYNLGILSFSEKQYQFATLKVLGFKDQQIRSIFIKQNNWITLLAILLGLPLGYLMLDYIYKNALSDAFDFDASVHLISYAYAILGTFIVSYVMNSILARKIKTIDMVSSLKANE